MWQERPSAPRERLKHRLIWGQAANLLPLIVPRNKSIFQKYFSIRSLGPKAEFLELHTQHLILWEIKLKCVEWGYNHENMQKSICHLKSANYFVKWGWWVYELRWDEWKSKMWMFVNVIRSGFCSSINQIKNFQSVKICSVSKETRRLVSG